MKNDPLNVRRPFITPAGKYTLYSLPALAGKLNFALERLPFSLRILLENNLRKLDGVNVTEEDIQALAHWQPQQADRTAVPFYPGRVLLQDFTGVPVLVDLAAMRSAVARKGGDPLKINPVVTVDLVIDHSLQVDWAGMPDALQRNVQREYERNRERYEFLRWGQQAFKNLRIVPPSSGIIHQVNLEALASGVLTHAEGEEILAYPDTLVGSDSHTTMVNGLGVLGWGVGGIEAAAAMLGQPLDLVLPDVTGVRLNGRLQEGVTPTDLVLTLTQMLRKKGVVNKFVEYFGDGLDNLSLPDRAMIANMTPENGSTMAYFPVDHQTLEYLRLSGRSEAQVNLVENYFREQNLFRTAATAVPDFSDVIEMDLDSIEPSLAGPRRPQDRVPLKEVKGNFSFALTQSKTDGGFAAAAESADQEYPVTVRGQQSLLRNGSVVIAAITSCTNTSDPYVMIAAGLLAKKAAARGLRVPPTVKISLTPGSRVVTEYLRSAGLLQPLAQLGFTLAGYGCATCIGNSGPLEPEIERIIREQKLAAAAVISGNRNFEGRVHPLVQANYLASPALVVAYALAGTVRIDLTREPLGKDTEGKEVCLKDLWPTSAEVNETIAAHVSADLFTNSYTNLFAGDSRWQSIRSKAAPLYPWQPASTYIQEPPFAEAFPPLRSDQRLRVLAVLGDSVTTDHISPAGDIPATSAAGNYLKGLGVPIEEFNSYGSRRGNYQVLTRGTLANIRIKNKMLPGVEGSSTLHLPDGKQMSIYEAAIQYKEEGVPLLILAGKEYGTGSSRDWAAKGPLLLGVRAVIAESFERIHRSNLVGMGILPLQFLRDENVESLGLNGRESYEIDGLDELSVGKMLTVRAFNGECGMREFRVHLCINTAAELAYFKQGGLLPAFVNSIINKKIT